MNEESQLWTLMKDYLPEWIISLILLILIFIYIYKQLKESFGTINLFKIWGRKKIKIKDLVNHQFFIFIEYMEKYKIDMMQFGGPGRTKIFREYFKLRCQTFNKKTKELITEGVLDNTSAEMKHKIFDALYSSITETNKTLLDDCNNDEERQIITFITQKFDKHCSSSVEAFKEVIDTIFDNGFEMNNNVERINSMLNIFLFVFVSTFAEAEKVLHMINGQISGKHYKGITIE